MCSLNTIQFVSNLLLYIYINKWFNPNNWLQIVSYLFTQWITKFMVSYLHFTIICLYTHWKQWEMFIISIIFLSLFLWIIMHKFYLSFPIIATKFKLYFQLYSLHFVERLFFTLIFVKLLALSNRCNRIFFRIFFLALNETNYWWLSWERWKENRRRRRKRINKFKMCDPI